NAGYVGFEECFEEILQANQAHFTALLQTLRGLDFPMAEMVRTMAGHQLRALSFSSDFRV
ncbi:MAG TPA: hypothetical protein VMF90_25350, partial [Rhizobiaceae bacterium]|nr:hypothetical protein [Rhizobiaceae bacterium]